MMDNQLSLSAPPKDQGGTVEIAVRDEVVRFAWGKIHELGTASYWVEQTRLFGVPPSYRLGQTLAEEVAACVLGGHGIPAEVGLAAFANLRDAGLLCPPGDPEAILDCLREPLLIAGRTRPVRYRFAAQRAGRVSAALQILATSPAPSEPLAMREFLLGFPGVGPKTASWVVRNWTGCDGLAIIDIHVQRAGVAAGFFSPHWRLPRDYTQFEVAFCAVARIGGVSAAALDACIWHQMQALGRAQTVLLGSCAARAA